MEGTTNCNFNRQAHLHREIPGIHQRLPVGIGQVVIVDRSRDGGGSFQLFEQCTVKVC
jgi:hypothetical protein